MPSPNFCFKQFEIYHDKCAMKVGMDGVTLGAWASLSESAKTSDAQILDVGTGSGLIALMLAQKYPSAHIDAIEIDASAAEQARENVRRSPWPKQVCVYEASFPEILDAKDFPKPAAGYHLIVSNPPFFKGELRPSDEARNLARHVGSLDFRRLTKGAASCLHPEGLFSVIIPYEAFDFFDECAYEAGLYLCRSCALVPVEGRAPKRILLSYGARRGQVEKQSLVVRNQDSSYTAEYHRLTKDFYLEK